MTKAQVDANNILAVILSIILFVLVGVTILLTYQNYKLRQRLTGYQGYSSDKYNYQCPENGWVDCMPVLDGDRQRACSSEAMVWYKTNCPEFQGAAL